MGPNTAQISLGLQVRSGPHGVPDDGAHSAQQLERVATAPPCAAQRSADELILQRLSITQSASEEHGWE
jgi:hypothetical protein